MAYFRDRNEAGKKLFGALEKYRGQPAVVYALPRGGIELGAVISKYLGVPLDLVIPRKVGHPNHPEMAICAVNEQGYRICNKSARLIDKQWLKTAIDREMAIAKYRRKIYLGERISPVVKNKIAIIVDDGIATGLTMRVAIHEIKGRQPSKIVVAVPVAPTDTSEQISAEVDEFIAFSTIPTDHFRAVGTYYDSFPQLSDEDIIKILRNTSS